jgi:hypothetical protein
VKTNFLHITLLALGTGAGWIAAPLNGFASVDRDPAAVRARSVRPAWASKSCETQTANGSYLVRTELRKERGLNEKVFLDERTNRALREQYETTVSKSEAREHAGLNEAVEEKSRFQAMKDMAKRAMDTISKLHAKVETNQLKKSSANTPGVREPVAAAVLAASLYTGRAMNFRLTEDVRVSSRAAIRDKAASLSMHLPAGLTSTVAYTRDQSTTAQISKSITDSVSAVVGSGARAKGSAQLVYSVSF